METREQARKLWDESGGQLPLKDIAARLGVSEGTLRSWKKRDGWGCDVATLRKGATQRETQRKRKAQTNRKAAESIEANTKLSDREKDFCAAFVHAPSASQAAVLTGRYETYGSARTAAYEMMQKPAVVAEITRLKAIKRATMLVDGDDVVELYMRIAFADVHAVMDLKAGVAVLRPADRIDGQLICEIKNQEYGLSIKLADRMEALKRLDNYFMLNPMDRHKKAYDEARLKLDEDKVKLGNEDALKKLDEMLAGIGQVMRHD